jgi:hypothetical protein
MVGDTPPSTTLSVTLNHILSLHLQPTGKFDTDTGRMLY